MASSLVPASSTSPTCGRDLNLPLLAPVDGTAVRLLWDTSALPARMKFGARFRLQFMAILSPSPIFHLPSTTLSRRSSTVGQDRPDCLILLHPPPAHPTCQLANHMAAQTYIFLCVHIQQVSFSSQPTIHPSGQPSIFPSISLSLSLSLFLPTPRHLHLSFCPCPRAFFALSEFLSPAGTGLFPFSLLPTSTRHALIAKTQCPFAILLLVLT
ncbi:unnamed protein product [Protopolystoma xenopodis]|uniref:Uncharacterized protein n=1 Tax=Protopolystoma xenopodis TaxID=117903 RepID=A0A448WM39_9PLAT|nr:unnamed protein product [Protopolystoma xenopodis]